MNSMYECQDCREVFSDPKWESVVYEPPRLVCSWCGSDDIEEMTECELCGKLVVNHKAGYCEGCYEIFVRFAEDMTSGMDEDSKGSFLCALVSIIDKEYF